MIKLPPLVHNWITYAGAAIAGTAFAAIVFLFVFDIVSGGHSPYAAIITFLVLPSAMMGGLLLIPIGMALEWRHWRRTGQRSIPTFPVLDLNQPRQRNATLIFAFVTLCVIFGSVFGSYQAYEATESVAFCGTVCHLPMQPEYTTYQNSPHARVRCVDCHVGPGADWFVKSKLDGLYQVYAVAFNKFPRPIPGTIKSLRPAQETCEQCHWPAKFFGQQLMRRVYYFPDETNSRWELRLLLKTGGSEPFGQQGQGIHWHMNIEERIEYIATDKNRQTIPWVRSTNKTTGESVTYVSTEEPLTDEQVAAAEKRQMDCIDCHNRPSHILLSPREAINRALEHGDMDPSLPLLVKTGSALLKGEYATVPEALEAIDTGLRGYYAENHPEIAASRADDIERAVSVLQQIYRENFFPEMKARWDVYPTNTGHMNFPGCMRCHDGKHESEDGKTITDKCVSCHVIVSQGFDGSAQFSMSPEGLELEHPEEVQELLEDNTCYDCHSED